MIGDYVTGCFGEPFAVAFEPKGTNPEARRTCRGLLVMPATNSAWLHMDLAKFYAYSAVACSTDVVDTTSQGVGKARRGEIVSKALNKASKADRAQLGPGFWKRLLLDFASAADAATKVDKKKHPVVCFATASFSGDAADAQFELLAEKWLSARTPAQQQEGVPNKVYLTLWDGKEANHVVTKASRDGRGLPGASRAGGRRRAVACPARRGPGGGQTRLRDDILCC